MVWEVTTKTFRSFAFSYPKVGEVEANLFIIACGEMASCHPIIRESSFGREKMPFYIWEIQMDSAGPGDRINCII